MHRPPLRVLIESYACTPGSSSERGLGWNWPKHLALAGCDITVLTAHQYRPEIDAELAAHPIQGLRVEYVRLRQWPLMLGWKIGSTLQYVIWLWAASSLGRTLHSENPFDICHHVSFGSLVMGCFLWRIDAPLVFGPAGGGQVAPAAFKKYFGRDWRIESIRTFIVRHLAVWSPVARKTCRASALVMVGNADTERLARRLRAPKVIATAPDSGVTADFAPSARPNRQGHAGLRLLWLGRILSIKALPLALDALALVDDPAVRLDILGSGTHAERVPGWIEERGLSDRVAYHGMVDFGTVREFYRSTDALLFVSLRDSVGCQLLEAMAWGLPIITLDHHGASWAVPNEAGIKVPVTDPLSTATALAAAIRLLLDNPDLRVRMGEAGFAHASGFTWSEFATRALGEYRQLASTRQVVQK